MDDIAYHRFCRHYLHRDLVSERPEGRDDGGRALLALLGCFVDVAR